MSENIFILLSLLNDSLAVCYVLRGGSFSSEFPQKASIPPLSSSSLWSIKSHTILIFDSFIMTVFS